MVDLAQYYDEGYITVKSIAQRQDISEKYLEQIINIISKCGYVMSIRGPKGGYKLSKPPKAFTAGMILRAVEGSLAPVECVEHGSSCLRSDFCSTYYLWGRIKTAVDEVVDSITLQDLLDNCTDKNNYSI